MNPPPGLRAYRVFLDCPEPGRTCILAFDNGPLLPRIPGESDAKWQHAIRHHQRVTEITAVLDTGVMQLDGGWQCPFSDRGRHAVRALRVELFDLRQPYAPVEVREAPG